MADDSRLELRARRDAALRALDAERRARRREATLRRRLESARERAATAAPATGLALATFAEWEALFKTEDAAAKREIAEKMTAAAIRAEGAREAALLDEFERARPRGGALPSVEGLESLPREEREAEESRSETLRALVAVAGDRAALADALRLAERAEWQLARCRDCLAPVKIDFLFDLRGGGFHHELAKSGRLDQAREYFLGARAALVRAETAVAAVSGAALPLDDRPFSPAAFWRALFTDFAIDGYVTTATGALKAMVERLHSLLAPLRTRAREAERDERRLEAELSKK